MAVMKNFTAAAIREFMDEKDGVKKPATSGKKPPKKAAPPAPEPVLTEGEQPDLVLPDSV